MNGYFDIGGITPTKYFFSIAIVLGLLFAMTSVEQDRPVVLVFTQWQLQTVVPMALLIGAHMLLLNSHWFAGMNPWFALSISGICGASLFAPIALTIDFLLHPLSQDASLASELLDEWVSVTPPVAICWVALNAPWVLGYRLEKSLVPEDLAEHTDSPPAGQPEFMSLLPPEKQGKLLFIKSELHYLKVVTECGSALILYNLSDAVAQLSTESGLSVHRSYWVALDAVDELIRQGRQGELKLSNGQTVPVSRNRLNEVPRRLSER